MNIKFIVRTFFKHIIKTFYYYPPPLNTT